MKFLKVFKKKKVLIGVVALLVLGAGYKFGYPMVAGKPTDATAASPTPVPSGPGPTYTMVDRVINLQAEGVDPRYIKLGVAVEFEVEDPAFYTLVGEALKAYQEELAGEMAAYQPQLDDAIVTIVSAKTMEELNSVVGKEQLRGELTERFAEIFGEHKTVKSVYFTVFVTQ